jgi:hypothetical protein
MFPRVLVKYHLLDLRDIELLPCLAVVFRAGIAKTCALLADFVGKVEAFNVGRQEVELVICQGFDDCFST